MGKAVQRRDTDGLKTRLGRGRKPIMDSSDEETVWRAVEQDRQYVSKAKDAWERAMGQGTRPHLGEGRSLYLRPLSHLNVA